MPLAARSSIILAGGGTGGSVVPLLAVAEELRRLQPDRRLLFVGTAGGPVRQLVTRAGLPFETIPAGKWRRYPSLTTFLDLVRIVAGVVVALRLLRRERPAMVVSAGGYVAVPVVWAAWLLRIPSLIHQQDLRPGLANRLMAPWASRITVTFPETARRFSPSRTSVTGNPVRASILHGDPTRARFHFGIHDDLPVILCLGGGTGALSLNHLIVRACLPLFNQSHLIHVTGEGKAVLGLTHPHYHARAFLTEELPDVYALAQVVVSRAGLSTLSELTTLGKPTIIVPLPATHQEENAEYFARRQAALIHRESDPLPNLTRALETLLYNPSARRVLVNQLQRLASPGAAQRLAAIIEGVIHDG